MKSHITLVALFLLSTVSMKAEIKNYFIEIKNEKLIIGEYKGSSVKTQSIEVYDFGNLNEEKIAKALLSDKEEKVLYYFHSMWGNVRPYHKNSLKKLNELEGLDKIISIVWHTDKVGYKGSWELAIEQGEKMSTVFSYLTQQKGKTNFVLCHSMGHRIFEGIVKNLEGDQLQFEKVIFAGADLDVDVFENNMRRLPIYCKKIILYFHQKDRLLKVSRKLLKRDRLGLNAGEHLEKWSSIKNLEVVNVTKASKLGHSRFTNHIYFKDTKEVRTDIQFLILGEEEKRREW